MNIKQKLFLPFALAVVLLGGGSYWLLSAELQELKGVFVEYIAGSKAGELAQNIELLSSQAQEQASLFARLPEVEEAYRKALAGNIDDEKDPASQEAREMLRKSMGAHLKGYESINGSKFKLHFHLPNGRSLVRLWSAKQLKRDGVDVDVSDDISKFRQTVVETNRSGKAVKGIEVGRGGFDVRGVVPVTDSTGKQLGSVEVLVEFAPLLKIASRQAGESLLLYMNSSLRSIAQGMTDPAKHPEVGGEFLFASGDLKSPAAQAVTLELLQKGKRGIHTVESGALSLTSFPVKDYRGEQVGVFVFANDLSRSQAIFASFGKTMLGSLLALLIVPGVLFSVLLSRVVSKPLEDIVSVIRDITEDKADLGKRLNDTSSDEVGALCRWFNSLLGKIEDMLCSIEGYKNVVNAIPDPVFAVDDDYNIILANTAVARIAGKKLGEDVHGMQCSSIFNAPVCGTAKCPITMAKKLNTRYEADVFELNILGETRSIRPYGDVIYDCHGAKAGYLEIASDVTQLALAEREMQHNLDRMSQLNEEVVGVASNVARAADSIEGQTGRVLQDAEQQSRLIDETVSAISQMNDTILEVARSAGLASQQAGSGQVKAQEGERIVAEAVQAIATVNQLADVLRTNLGELGQQAESIGQIMNVISDIADQTNLLALNAAIEAARAGEAGRGFAVVADEVRKLAEKTMSATQEVRRSIETIQAGASRNITSMEQVTAAVTDATDHAQRSGAALREIVALVNDTSSQVASIATAAEEQSASSEEIKRSVDRVSELSAATTMHMQDAAQSVNELATLASRLSELARS